MSGGGGGGADWRPTSKPVGQTQGTGNGGPPQAPDPCIITETTNVNSPDPAIVTTLVVGEVLDVVLDQGPPVRVLVRKGTGTLGSITSSHMRQLIDCLRNQRRYSATVLTVRGGMVQVRISLV
jgi:hypothetical protein